MFVQLLDIKSYFSRASVAFRALKSRNYALYMGGMLVSVIGTWIQIIAMGWLVYRLTDSALLLGVVGFASQIPSLIFAPLAGVYADRLNRRKVIIGTQTASMLLAFVLAALVLSDNIEVWHLITLAVLNGITNSIDTPFRHAFVRDLVTDKSQLQNAIALNSTLFNSARFIGPVIGGVLIAAVGEGWCFFINAMTFVAVLVSLFLVKTIFSKPQKSENSILKDMSEGFEYAFNNKSIRYMLILVVSSGLFCLPFQTFLPVFAKDILNGDSGLYGILTGAYGAGALTGALFLAMRKSIRGLPGLILFASALFTTGLSFFAFSQWIWLSVPLLVFSGFGMISQYTSVNTLIQTIAEPSMAGRVLSLYGMSFMTVSPLGAILLGWLSGIFDIRYVIFGSSLISVVAIIIYAVNRNVISKTVSELDISK